jgi:hypothetical protein
MRTTPFLVLAFLLCGCAATHLPHPARVCWHDRPEHAQCTSPMDVQSAQQLLVVRSRQFPLSGYHIRTKVGATVAVKELRKGK